MLYLKTQPLPSYSVHLPQTCLIEKPHLLEYNFPFQKLMFFNNLLYFMSTLVCLSSIFLDSFRRHTLQLNTQPLPSIVFHLPRHAP